MWSNHHARNLLLVHELVSPSSIVLTFYPVQKPKLPHGPAHRSRIGPRRVSPQFHDLFIEVSVSPMLPRFSLRLPRVPCPGCPQSKGNTSFRDDEVMLPACPFHLILLAVDDCLTASLSPPSYCRSWCFACVVQLGCSTLSQLYFTRIQPTLRRGRSGMQRSSHSSPVGPQNRHDGQENAGKFQKRLR